MKKFDNDDISEFCNKYIIGIYILIGLIAFAAFLLSLPHRLGSINESNVNIKDGVSYITFNASEGDEIKIESYFVINSGKVNIYLYDPDEKCINLYEVISKEKQNNILKLVEAGEYRVQLEYSNYIGSLDVGIFRMR